jgi:aryl-alcohol dehydrogenase-like predicted oxidoreductase
VPLNHYVTLGRSGLRVSPLCLGAMTFGEDWGWGSSVEDSVRMLNRYVQLGGNFVDTANMYTFGHSESIVGDYLAADRSRRQELVIATKFFGSMQAGNPNAGGAGRKNIVWACEQSLRRLKTDYIDLYWMHCWDYQTPIEETMHALDHLVAAGKVRYIGFSDTPAWKCAQAQMIAHFRDWTPLIALQIEYSLLERSVEGELVPMALELGLGITPWSPLKYGILSGKYRRSDQAPTQANRGEWVTSSLNDRAHQIVEVLTQVAQEAGVSPARAAIRWLQARPGVAATIVGARTLEQLDDNLSSIDVSLSAEQLQRLSDASVPELNFPAAFLKRSPAFRNPMTVINGEAAGPNALAASAATRKAY